MPPSLLGYFVAYYRLMLCSSRPSSIGGRADDAGKGIALVSHLPPFTV